MSAQLKLILIAGLSGAAVALKGDYETFKAFKSFDDFAKYNWTMAAWRGVQGFIVGALTTLTAIAAGYNQAVTL